MLVIRLSRKGRRNRPMYRITVAENSKPTGGKFVEVVGHYNPIAADQPLSVNKERVEYWLSQGVKPSNTVARLLNRVGFNLPVIQKQKPAKKRDKQEVKTDSASQQDVKKVEEVQESKVLKEEESAESEPIKEKIIEKPTEKLEKSTEDLDK